MAVGDILKVRNICYRPGFHLGVNVTHWESIATTGAGVTLKEFVIAYDATVAAAYLSVLSQGARYRGTGAQKIHPAPVSAEAASVLNDAAGTEASDLMQTQSGLIRKRTNLAGRKYRGRIYIPFPGEARNDATGNPDATYTAKLALLAIAIDVTQVIVGAGGTETFQQVLYHRLTNTWTPIESLTSEILWATQRRRSQRGKLLALPF